jgi:iron complex outermembrane receptor protein
MIIRNAMKKIIITFAIWLYFLIPVFATENLETNTVLVTASRVHDNIQNIPANIQVISREEIQEINSISIPQILSQLGGLNISGTALGQFNQGATVDIGGYGATAGSTTLVLINGQRISPIDSSSAPWEMIPVKSIDRIEIIRGGASVQYGDRAVGGVINIITNESQKSINQASMTVGSFGSREANVIFQNKFNNTLFKIAGSANHSDGWRQNTTSDQYSLNARLTQFFDTNYIYIEGFVHHNKNETPGAVIDKIGLGSPKSVKCDIYSCFKGSYNEYDNYGLALGGIYDLSTNIKFEGDLSYKNTKSNFYKEGDNQADPADSYAYLFAPPKYVPYLANYDRWHIDFSPRFKIDLKKLGNLIVGYDYSRALGSSNDAASYVDYTSFTNSNASLINNSLYLNHIFSISENLDFITGFRKQNQNITANDFDGYESSAAKKTTSANAWELAINFKLSEFQKLYIKYGQSFRFPNLDEFWGYSSSGRTFFGGIINPQIDRTLEIGSDFILGNTKVTTSVFHTRTQDGIRYQVANGKNINDEGIVDRNGIFLSTNSSITDRVSFYTNSKLQEATYVNGPYNGKSFDLVPNLLINARLSYKFDNELSVGAISNYVSSQYYDGANDMSAYNKIPSYIVTDFYLSKKIYRWDLKLTAKNITNERYASYGGYQDKNDGGTLFYKGYYYYPSDPRSLFASVSYNF